MLKHLAIAAVTVINLGLMGGCPGSNAGGEGEGEGGAGEGEGAAGEGEGAAGEGEGAAGEGEGAAGEGEGEGAAGEGEGEGAAGEGEGEGAAGEGEGEGEGEGGGPTSTQEACLGAGSGDSAVSLGSAVAMSADGSRMIVGAPSSSASQGIARIYVRVGSSWSEEATLTNGETPTDNDLLGTSVAMSGDGTRVVVGIPKDDVLEGDDGSAQIFVRNGSTWAFEQTLAAPVPGNGAFNQDDHFGSAVAIDGDGTRVVVGSPLDDTIDLGSNSGSAHVFLRGGTSWGHEQTLLPSNLVRFAFFGGSVAITPDGTRLVVGSPDDTLPGHVAGSGDSDEGTARVFVRDSTSWTEEAILQEADADPVDRFGVAVAISSDGDRIVVAAEGDDIPGIGSDLGSARVFVRSTSTWTQEGQLLSEPANDGSIAPQFIQIQSVAMSADGATVLVGSVSFTKAGGFTNIGSGQRFVRTGSAWAHDLIVLPDVFAPNDVAGTGVALSADATRAAIGANGADAGVGRTCVHLLR